MLADAIQQTLSGCPDGAVFCCYELEDISIYTPYRAHAVPFTKEDLMHLDWFEVDTKKNYNNVRQLDNESKRKIIYGK